MPQLLEDQSANGGAPALTAAAGASQESIAATFAADPRIHFSTATGRWAFEDDNGNEWEYDANKGVWLQVVRALFWLPED